jgi:succinate dehydrogenase/fumarate reductase flavoprotein subunit
MDETHEQHDVVVVGGGAAGRAGVPAGSAINNDLIAEDTRVAVERPAAVRAAAA